MKLYPELITQYDALRGVKDPSDAVIGSLMKKPKPNLLFVNLKMQTEDLPLSIQPFIKSNMKGKFKRNRKQLL